MSREPSLGAGGRGPAAPEERGSCIWTGDRVGASWGKALHFTFSSSPRGRRRDARRPQPQPWRGTRSPALARCASRWERREAGPDGRRAAPPGRRFLTDTKPRHSPRLNRKPGGVAAGPAGAPRARLLRSPVLLVSAAFSRPRGSRPAGRKAAARRRKVGGRGFAGPAARGGLGSKLGAAAGAPGGKGRWGPVERAESPGHPALSFFSFARVSPPTVRGRGEGRGRGRGACAARGRPRTPRPGAFRSRSGLRGRRRRRSPVVRACGGSVLLAVSAQAQAV